MPIPIPDFEGENQKAIRRNLDKVITDLGANTKGIQKKIQNFRELFDFSEEEVRQEIRDRKLFRAKFAKDPRKQGIHEKLAGAFIESLPNVGNFKVLPKSKLQLLGGLVMSKKEVKERGGTGEAKTLDFEWQSKGKQIYASHKYTKDGGGGQDNQYRDMKDFIREANKSHTPNTIFLAIADGPYYGMNDTGSRTTKLQNLQYLANRTNVFALSGEELEEFLNNLS